MGFELPPIEVAAIQSAILNATSNLLAQVISAYRNEVRILLSWRVLFSGVHVIHFVKSPR